MLKDRICFLSDDFIMSFMAFLCGIVSTVLERIYNFKTFGRIAD